MIKVEDIEIWGFRSAIKGMRNPMNSWIKSDSVERLFYDQCICFKDDGEECIGACPDMVVGKNDLDLMQRLFKGGPVHAKYLRMIHVQMDIIAPLYWWKEFDTYKVGTVANSCSTMHKIHSKEFKLEDFSHDHLNSHYTKPLNAIVDTLNVLREVYLKNKNKETWYAMIQLLPSSYNQRRTVDLNYQVIYNILEWRQNHKLDEWREFCNILLSLPYVKEISGK